jgi:hypothetical protein
LEFLVSSKNIVQKDFQWSTDFNISFNRNNVTALYGQQYFLNTIAGRSEASLVNRRKAAWCILWIRL